jgi:hypothetical protein
VKEYEMEWSEDECILARKPKGEIQLGKLRP